MMKKYTTPELSISVFDVEDIITASGIASNGLADAIASHGDLFKNADASDTTKATVANAAVVYFSWE